MKKFISLFVVAGALVACGSPCEKAADAAGACLDEAGIEYEEASCEDDDGSNDETFECVADAYSAADWSTEEGALAATLVAATCAGDLGLSDSGM